MMRRKPGGVRLVTTEDGRMLTESNGTESGAFRQFVQTADPSYLPTLNKLRSCYVPHQHSKVSQAARRGKYRVYQRNKNFTFSFGFQDNEEFSVSNLLRFYGQSGLDPGLTVEEKVQVVLDKNPHIQEGPKNEAGDRTFYRSLFDRNKRGWDYHISDDTVRIFK